MPEIDNGKRLSEIEEAKKSVRESEAFVDLCKKHDIDPNYIYYIPVCFSDLDVSARTDNGIIYLNSKLISKIKDIEHYLMHESAHWIQQCFGDGPTEPSDEDDYLSDPNEVESFRYQSEFIAETEGEDEAEDYINQVLDHHEVDGKERGKRKKDLLNISSALYKLEKQAAEGVETIRVKVNDPIVDKYHDQIKAILKQRYVKELGYARILDYFDFIDFDKFGIDEFILSIDTAEDKVIAVSGVDDKFRVKLLALSRSDKAVGNVKKNTKALFGQFEALFGGKESYAEVTTDLFDKISRIYKLYRKSKDYTGAKIYIFPAEAAASLIPNRNMLVRDDGVVYQKRVVRAGTFANKVLIGNSLDFYGLKGYSTYEEASANAKYKGKLIKGTHWGSIEELYFDPELWKGSTEKKATAGHKKKDINLPDIKEALKKYVTDSPPYNYIHFSDDAEFWGVNVKTEYNTPLGIYTYPLTTERYNRIITKNIEFAGSRKFIHIYRPKTQNILYIDRYNIADLAKDISKLENKFEPEKVKEYCTKMQTEGRINNPAGNLFYLVFRLSGGTGYDPQNKSKARAIFVDLGYDAIHDSGLGIIHSNEPTQAVFFASKFFEILDVIKNPIFEEKQLSRTKSNIFNIITNAMDNDDANALIQALKFIDAELVTSSLLEYGTESNTNRISVLKLLGSKFNKKIKEIQALRWGISFYKEKIRKLSEIPDKYVAEYIDQEKINKWKKRYKNSYILLEHKDRFFKAIIKEVISATSHDTKLIIEVIKLIPDEYANILILYSKDIASWALDTIIYERAERLDLRPLINSKSSYNRRQAASNLDDVHLLKLIKDPEYEVRAAVAQKINEKYLPLMLDDSSSGVLSQVIKRIDSSHLPRLRKHPYREVRSEIALRIDSEYLPTMIDDDHFNVRLIVSKRIDPEFLHLMINDPSLSVIETVAERVPPEWLPEMLKYNKMYIINIVVKRIISDGRYVDKIARHGTYEAKRLAISEAHPNDLPAFMHDESYYLRREVVLRIPKRYLRDMIDDPSGGVRAAVVRRNNEFALEMINDEDAVVRAQVVNVIHKDYLPKMINDDSAIVREVAASRMRPDQLLKIMHHVDPAVRKIVAERISEKLLPKMMNDGNEDVRSIVSRRVPSKYIDGMIEDSSRLIRRTVAKRVGEKHLPKMIDDKNDSVRRVVSRRIDKSYLPIMMDDRNASVRRRVATRINPKYLERMMDDHEVYVRQAVAKRIPRNRLLHMIHDDDSRVRELITGRLPKKQLYRVINDKSNQVRRLVARLIPKEQLPLMMSDNCTTIRKIVAERIPEEYIEKMIENERTFSSWEVFDMLQARLNKEKIK
jgi:hypothetical protein